MHSSYNHAPSQYPTSSQYSSYYQIGYVQSPNAPSGAYLQPTPQYTPSQYPTYSHYSGYYQISLINRPMCNRCQLVTIASIHILSVPELVTLITFHDIACNKTLNCKILEFTKLHLLPGH